MAEEGDQADMTRAQLGRKPSLIGLLYGFHQIFSFMIIETACSIMFCVLLYGVYTESIG